MGNTTTFRDTVNGDSNYRFPHEKKFLKVITTGNASIKNYEVFCSLDIL
jgi:hypothetical protein